MTNHMRDSSKDPSRRTRREELVDAVVLTVIAVYWIYVLVFA